MGFFLNKESKTKKEKKKKVATDVFDKVVEQDDIVVPSITDIELLQLCENHFMESKDLEMVNRGLDNKDKKWLLNRVKSYAKQRGASEEQAKRVTDMFEKQLWGYGLIEPLLLDKDITDIKLMAYDCVRAKKLGMRFTTDVKFSSNEEMNNFIKLVAIKNSINTSPKNAVQTFTDKDTYDDFILRIDIEDEYINSVPHSYMHIRKIPKTKFLLHVLVTMGMLTSEEANYLATQVKEGRSFIFAGRGSSGKTTLINALLEEVPETDAGLIIQENEELFLNEHPEFMRQVVRTAKGEGSISYTLKELSINGLLADIDWFIIGEIKGGEAKYFQNAFYTGYSCMTSIHANSATHAVDKMCDYMKYESDFARDDLMRMLSRIDLVVYLKRFKVKEIVEVMGFKEDEKLIDYNKVFVNNKKVNESKLDEKV